MRHPNARARVVSWILAASLPILAAIAAWVWTGMTTSSRDCVTGDGGSGLEIVGLAVLVLIPPVTIGWRSRRMTGSASRAVSPIVIATMLGVVAVLLSAQAWWGSHNCYT